MKEIIWNNEKNKILKIQRGISFEEISYYIENKEYIDIIEHSNKEKYPNQKMFVIIINDYIYLVPFVENDEKIFLKTIFPSRVLTKKYLGKEEE